MKNKGKGNLPETCPNCKTKDVHYEWEVGIVYDEEITNKAVCPNCDAEFEEIMKVVSWSKK